MQLYTMKDLELQGRIIHRAERAGCKAIFLTADSPVLGVRYNEWRNDFRTLEGLDYPTLERKSTDIRRTNHEQGFMVFNDDAHFWGRDIPLLRKRTGMQIWIKGVIWAEDVERAVDAGCDGVIVSFYAFFCLLLLPLTILKVSNQGGDNSMVFRPSLMHCPNALLLQKGGSESTLMAVSAEALISSAPLLWGQSAFGLEDPHYGDLL